MFLGHQNPRLVIIKTVCMCKSQQIIKVTQKSMTESNTQRKNTKLRKHEKPRKMQ